MSEEPTKTVELNVDVELKGGKTTVALEVRDSEKKKK